jgi:hypothetical protein
VADVFLSYSRADQERAAAMAGALEARGRSLWWDRRLAAGADYAAVIEQEINAARCVVVAWSKTARNSLWVRAEANAALDAGKVIQLTLDPVRPPLPFTMLHLLDFSAWRGQLDQQPWPELEAEIGRRAGETSEPEGRRPDPGGVPVIVEPGTPLGDFGRIALIGWVAAAAALLVGIAVLLAVRGAMGAETLAVVSFAALALALALVGLSAFLLARTLRASRR